ncbi:hypothetical protein SODALDRAFT_325651 [Sodiomyces alkalinus F11]|uniref:Myb-like domain-containing protein n=1 Tax=Sodiomyces alkalinus (strain CBS 110278 / VKM F-3762 / F11) TaxID=1314773 RepID=A0A3N2PPK5_SODAK|nr:hypothetical protein SODALDRAFT_325651 [Sodiomyces alkalinus F11]ROT36296.1 hypothetical protein SODALDRAFT_325651 [Sodiomyces alkalinus F11]
MYSQRLSIPDYYSVPSSSASAPSHAQPATFDTYTTVPPVSAPPVQHRASSGAWTAHDDQRLLQARAQGLNWAQIQATYFSNKTPNACRKRHERLMERKGADDWDNRKLELIAKEYMSMRKEIWSGLAARTGEKWNVVEAKCMSNGLKNLQSAARAYSRRERLETGQALPPGYDDDSGISGIGLTPVDDLDPSYSSPETASSGGHSVSGGSAASVAGFAPASHHHHHHHQQQQQQHFSMHPMHSADYYASAATHHGYTSSVSSTASGPAGYATSGHHHHQHQHSQSPSPYLHPHAQRLPSVDMGIDAIINRPRGGRGGGAPPPM